MKLDYIPSPSQGVWYLGPLPVRAYALCIIAGILVALWWTKRRWAARGGRAEDMVDVVMWAVPFGVVGGRLYHLVTDPELYFVPGRNPWNALKIWDGGLGIWGAVALGAVGAWIGCRRKGIALLDFADTAAPGLVLAQAIGRWGNYFNQELFGGPTTLPWGLLIDPAHRPAGSAGIGVYQPTFLYESIWDVGVAVLLVWAQRRFALRGGRVFALYVAAYTVGRGWIEALRVDHANHFLGLRLNDWTSVIVFTAAVAFLLLRGRHRPAARPATDPDGLGAPHNASSPQPQPPPATAKAPTATTATTSATAPTAAATASTGKTDPRP